MLSLHSRIATCCVEICCYVVALRFHWGILCVRAGGGAGAGAAGAVGAGGGGDGGGWWLVIGGFLLVGLLVMLLVMLLRCHACIASCRMGLCCDVVMCDMSLGHLARVCW